MFSAPPLTPFVKKLIITLFVAFVAELVLQNFLNVNVFQMLSLDPLHLSTATPFKLFSYVLVENIFDSMAVMSVLVGLLFMWLIMSPFEAAFGPRRTLELSLAGVLGAALAAIIAAQVLSGFAAPVLFGSNPIPYAGMAAMTRVIKRGRIMFLGMIPMTPQQMLMCLVGFSVLIFLFDKNHIMLAASLGAIAAGLGYVNYMTRTPKSPRPNRTSSSKLRVIRGGGESESSSDRPKWLN